MTLPNLICLGPPKCGTTTLYSVCESHPDIYVSLFKEPQFFNNDEKYSNGLEWYSNNYFSTYDGQKYITDFTPGYFSNEIAIKRIVNDLGLSTKIIYILRNPSQRAYSHYLHWQRDGQITEPFMDFLYSKANNPLTGADKINRIYTDSLYDIHIQALYEHLPDTNNVLPLIFEEDVVKNNSIGFKQKISQFLDIDQSLFSNARSIKNNSQSVSKFGLAFKRIINSDSFLKRSAKKILSGSYSDNVGNFLNDRINKVFHKDVFNSIDEATFKKLNNEIFIDSIHRVEKILQKPLNHWYE